MKKFLKINLRMIFCVLVLLFCYQTYGQKIDGNLKFSRSFKNEQIYFIERINDTLTIAASQRNAYLFNDLNLVIDTINQIQDLSQRNLIQNIELLAPNMLFVGTMQDLMIFNFNESGLELSTNISYNKAFAPWRQRHQLRYLTNKGFLGISLPLGNKTNFNICYYPRKEGFENGISLYEDVDSNYTVFARSQWSKMVDFIDDFILINDLYKSKSVLYTQSTGSLKVINLPLYKDSDYSFISYDKSLKRCYLVSKSDKGATYLGKYDLKLEEVINDMSLIDINVYSIEGGQIWYKDLIEPERILGLFSVPLEGEATESVFILDEVKVKDQ